MLMYLLGAILVVVGIAMFFFETGLNRWVPTTLLIAGIILVLGLSVMGFANNAPEARRTYVEDDVPRRDGDVIIRK
jgi:hypothetical protein